MRPLELAAMKPILDEVELRGNRVLAQQLSSGERVLVLDPANRLHLVAKAAVPLLSKKIAPDAFGEPWGTFEDGKWTPSLAAMVRVGAATRYRRIVISASAAQHFLYSKGVHKPGIVEKDLSLKVGDDAWITDESGMVLGRAKILSPTEKLRDMLRPLDDLGWYLREGG